MQGRIAERARDLKKEPVYILGTGEAMRHAGRGKRDFLDIAAAQSGKLAFERAIRDFPRFARKQLWDGYFGRLRQIALSSHIWVANPVKVRAFKITHVGDPAANGSCLITIENKTTRLADAGMLARMIPVVGDYWVIQSDGYEYVNPREVFERKYSPAGLKEFRR